MLLIGPFMLASALGPKAVLGVEVSDRPGFFCDAAKTLRPFAGDDEKPVPTDSNGWPKGDGLTVIFDDRPALAWAPPEDDPAHLQPQEAGVYAIKFKGRAQVSAAGGSPIQLGPDIYDAATNTSSGSFVLPKTAANLVVLKFSETRRSPQSTAPDGITDLRVYRPGTGSPGQIFTNDLIKALAPFSYLRCMGWLGTNFQPGFYGDTGHHLIGWNDRTLPTDATQGMEGLRPGTIGVAWEYPLLLANQTHKDLWINIPVSATGTSPDDKGSYIYKLAELIKNGDAFTGGKGLASGLHLYIEHSNEVWNFGFPQYIWNKLAAIDEVKQGGSTLNNDGATDQEAWAHRRHAKRLYEIAKIFERVFGPGSLGTVVRPVYASWTIFPDAYYGGVLAWMKKTYADPKGYFYAMAGTGYFNAEKASKTASPSEIVGAMRADGDSGVATTVQLKKIAEQYGLKLACYEAGPDNGGGDPTNVGNRILANRLPEMGDLVTHEFRDNLFGAGVDLASYFSLASAGSRYGCWGALEDLSKLDTAKYKAILGLTGTGN